MAHSPSAYTPRTNLSLILENTSKMTYDKNDVRSAHCKVRHMKANPGGYIPPQEVIGRDQLIERLWRILARQSLVLTAERRTGKTSILRKMEAEPPADMLVVFHELENINTPPGYPRNHQHPTRVRSPL